MSFIIIIVSFIISLFGFSQIFGSIIYKILSEKQFKYFITIFIWLILMFGFYLIIKQWFSGYFDYYLYSTIVGAVIALFTVKKE